LGRILEIATIATGESAWMMVQNHENPKDQDTMLRALREQQGLSGLARATEGVSKSSRRAGCAAWPGPHVDESGEDYLYPAEFFAPVAIAKAVDHRALFAS
jgi:hypothetical protein